MEQLNDGSFISGHIHVDIYNYKTGEHRSYDQDNKILNAYLSRIAEWSSGVNNVGQNPAYPPTKFMFGTGTGTITGDDVSLFNQTSSSLISASIISYNGGVTTLTINYAPNVIVGTYTEAGLLDVNSVLMTHLLLSPEVTVYADESVSITYTVTFTAQ